MAEYVYMLRILSFVSHLLTLNVEIMKFSGHFYGQSVFYAVFLTLVRQFYTIHQMRIVYPLLSLRASLEKVEWIYQNCAIIPTGDFNKSDIKSVAKTFQLKSVVNFRTRPINTLDKFFSILLEYYSSFNSFPQFGLSDHLTIVVSPGFSKKSQKPRTIYISNSQSFDIKWAIVKRATAYTSGAKRCNLCLEEKLCIMKARLKTHLKNLMILKQPDDR